MDLVGYAALLQKVLNDIFLNTHAFALDPLNIWVQALLHKGYSEAC